MGLGEVESSAEKKGSVAVAEEIYCSICLDIVRFGGKRSTAKLQCGHDFHLDCIGSAFNAKGVMQCPNCREIGKGNWLYSNGSRSIPDRFDEWPLDEDLYDFNYPEVPFVHWCPYSRLARVLPSFEEGENSPAIAFQDVGFHAMFTGDPATSSPSHQCPYLAYMPPLQSSSSSNHPILAESHNDGPTFHHHWSHTPRQTEVQTPHVLPAVDHHYHNWEHRSPIYSQASNHSSGSNHDTDSSATVRAVRLDLDGQTRTASPVHHFVVGHGSSSSRSTVAPPYFANSQSYPHVHEHYQHQNPPSMHRTIFSGPRRSGARGLPPVAPHMPQLDPTTYYLFPPTASSSRSSQEAESMRGDHFYAWGRDRFAPFPLLPVDREASWWGPLPHSTTGSSDSNSRWGIWHRNGSERSSSQGRAEGSSYRSPVTRMMP